METTEEGWVEITQPDVVELIVKLGALQLGDKIRFSPQCYDVVSIPTYMTGEWDLIAVIEAGGDCYRTARGWVFSKEGHKAIGGWRRRVDKNLG